MSQRLFLTLPDLPPWPAVMTRAEMQSSAKGKAVKDALVNGGGCCGGLSCWACEGPEGVTVG